MGPGLAPLVVHYGGPVVAAGVLYGLGHVIGFFHGKSVERKLTAAAKKVISTAAQ